MKTIISKTNEFVATASGNHLLEQDAIYPELAGLTFYDEPIFGFASAEDSIFTEKFKKVGVIHPDYKAPKEWLENAQTVISFFLPFSEEVRISNRTSFDEPYAECKYLPCSVQWLHARIEGQMFMNQVTDYIQKLLTEAGYESVCPATSKEFGMVAPFVSNWSERHAAYAAGLGTFGLSKGLITRKGMAGRFGSVITNARFEVTPRPYSSPFEYCTMCGACMKRCPAGAIDITKGCALGKDQEICSPYVNGANLPLRGPEQRKYYGCGKCQVAVPCEHQIPKKLTK